MKQLFYTIRYLLRNREKNMIKIISLTLGLAVGLVLFSQVAFELSFDKFYPDADRIFSIHRNITMNDENGFKYDGPIINAPVPGALHDNLSEVEEATVLGSQGELPIVYNDKLFKEEVCVADSSFFDVFGIQILEGEKEKLALTLNMFLSESAAKRIFGSENPVGKTILLNKKDPVTICGVYKDIPKNSHLSFDVILSFKTLTQSWGYNPGWMNNDAYRGYVKLREGATVSEVEAKIPALLYKYYDVDALKSKGIVFSYFLKPVTELHSGDPTTKRMLSILSLLAFAMLFVSAMNYVLISISSLAVRAKSVGVHKCSGASDGNIFSMFIYETGVLVLISLLLSALLIFAFRGSIEVLIQSSLLNLFSLSNLWVTLLVVLILLLLAGVIPARIFSAIPVTQVFRTYTANKRYWKRGLLFIQFAGIAFMLTLLTIITIQYNLLMNKDLGYTTENMIYSKDTGNLFGEKAARLKAELSRLPEVEMVTLTSSLPGYGMNGDLVADENKEDAMVSVRFMQADKDFIDVFGMTMKEGENFSESKLNYNHAIVNESFVKKMQWTGPAVGKVFVKGRNKVEVTGVVKNFQIGSLYTDPMYDDIPPLIYYSQGETEGGGNILVVRLNHFNPTVIADLSARLRELLNNEDAYFEDYRMLINDSYKSARLFRNSILVASGLMLIITLLGLLGYTEDEIHRRSKEIAVRKVNGATAKDILYIISKDISVTALPAIVIGLGISYVVGANWLMQFAAKISLNTGLFIVSGIIVLAIIIICITLRAWGVANENPVNSIKSE